MNNIDWKPVSEQPKTFGWYCVAKVSANHSGIADSSLEEDNIWRESFGFSFCWFNNGRWFEPDATGYGTSNITERVTHWSPRPPVPILSKSFIPNKNTLNLEYVIDVEDIIKSMGADVNNDTVLGFQIALKLFLRK